MVRNIIFYFFIFILSVASASSIHAQGSCDSIQQKIESITKTRKNDPPQAADTLLIQLYWAEGKCLTAGSELDKAKNNFENALSLSVALNNETAIVNSYTSLAKLAAIAGDTSEATKDFKTAITLLKKGSNKTLLAGTILNLGLFYYSTYNYPNALQAFSRADSLFVQLDRKKGIAFCVFNIGLINDDLGNTDRATEKYMEAKRLFEELDDQVGLGRCYVNMGLILQNKKEIERALDNYLKAIRIFEKQGSMSDLSIVLNNYGYLLLGSNKFSEAITYLRRSERISRNSEDKGQWANTQLNIAEYFSKTGHQDSAMAFLERGMAYGKQIQDRYLQMESYRILAMISAGKREFEKAYALKERYEGLHDSINSDERIEKFNRMQIQFDLEKKDASDKADREKADLVVKEEAKKQKIILYFVLGCLGLVIFVALLIFRSYSVKKKANLEITRQKEMVEQKQKEILDSIRYAKRIQHSLLPSDKYLDKELKRMKRS